MNVLDKEVVLKYIDQRLRGLKEREHDLNTYRELVSMKLLITQNQFSPKLWED